MIKLVNPCRVGNWVENFRKNRVGVLQFRRERVTPCFNHFYCRGNYLDELYSNVKFPNKNESCRMEFMTLCSAIESNINILIPFVVVKGMVDLHLYFQTFLIHNSNKLYPMQGLYLQCQKNKQKLNQFFIQLLGLS